MLGNCMRVLMSGFARDINSTVAVVPRLLSLLSDGLGSSILLLRIELPLESMFTSGGDSGSRGLG